MAAFSSLARGSVLARTASRATDRLRTAVNASRIGHMTRTVLAPLRSILERTASTETGPVLARDRTAGRMLRGSALTAVASRFDTRLRSAADGSTLHRAVDTVVAVTRNSWGYRWLTGEPDPEVVVIDLRRTWSVGPPLAVIDRVVDAVVPGIEGATAVRAAERVAGAVRRRPIAIASALALGVLAASLLASIAVGSPSRRLLAVWIVLAAVATLGLRSHATLRDLRTTRTARLLVAVLEPPDPPDEHDATGATSDRAEHGHHATGESGAEEPDERADGDEERGAR